MTLRELLTSNIKIVPFACSYVNYYVYIVFANSVEDIQTYGWREVVNEKFLLLFADENDTSVIDTALRVLDDEILNREIIAITSKADSIELYARKPDLSSDIYVVLKGEPILGEIAEIMVEMETLNDIEPSQLHDCAEHFVKCIISCKEEIQEMQDPNVSKYVDIMQRYIETLSNL